MNRLSRRTLIKRGGIAGAAATLLTLAGCPGGLPPWLGGTDYLGEAAAAFTSGSIGLVAIGTLVSTGVISKAKAQSFNTELNAVAATFATLHTDGDSGAGLGQAAIDAAVTAWNAFQQAIKPVVASLTMADVHAAHAALLARPKAVNWAGIISWVLSNLGTLTSAGGAIGSLVQFLVSEVQAISAGSTTVAQFDAAYASWTTDLASYQAEIA